MSLWGDCPYVQLINFNQINVYNYNVHPELDYFCIDISSHMPILVSSKIRSNKRIGPHNQDVISFIYGALLSDAYAERHGNGTRISQQQESNNREFIEWYNNFLIIRGYITPKNLKIQYRIGTNCKKRYYYKSVTNTYTSFNWIYDSFYKDSIKFVPVDLDIYLTPLALAIWIMGDGSKASAGCKQSTNSYTKSDCDKICYILKTKFNIYSSVNSAGVPNQWVIYIWKNSLPTLISIVKPYMVTSMHYKLHI